MRCQLLKANALAGLLRRPQPEPHASAVRPLLEVFAPMVVLHRERDAIPGSRLRGMVVLSETSPDNRVAATLETVRHNN